MQRLILGFSILSLGCVGCANAKHTATTIAAASDLTADTLAESWDGLSNAQIEHCRAQGLETSEEREECLGDFTPKVTDKIIAAVKVLVAAQTAVKAAAECEELKSCIESPDWAQLAKDLKAAWDALLPYVQKAKESVR